MMEGIGMETIGPAGPGIETGCERLLRRDKDSRPGAFLLRSPAHKRHLPITRVPRKRIESPLMLDGDLKGFPRTRNPSECYFKIRSLVPLEPSMLPAE